LGEGEEVDVSLTVRVELSPAVLVTGWSIAGSVESSSAKVGAMVDTTAAKRVNDKSRARYFTDFFSE
jgi:hypothetical protein